MKKGDYLIITYVVFLVIFSVPLFFGNFFEDFTQITGRLTTGLANVSITVGNTAPQITFVSGVPAVSATESGSTYTIISFLVNDSDGSSNLNDTSGQVRFMNSSVPITRVNYTCAKVNNPDSNSGNYTCRVDLWYFDPPVNYTINVTFGDINGARTENSTTQLEFTQLTAVQISPTSLSWPSIGATSTNISSSTALNISNTGNKNIANGSTTLTAIDLSGEITKIERIFVGNISITHIPGLQCNNNNATLLFNNTAKPVRPNGTLPRGNNTLNSGTLNATICLQSINSSVSAQKYSTNGSGTGQEWTVTIS